MVILLLGFTLRLVWVLAIPTRPISDFAEFDRLAVGLVNGQGYLNTQGQPTAYRSPGYPFFVAGVYAVFGPHDLAIKIVQVFLGVLTGWLTYLLARKLFDLRSALVSTLLVALFPSLIAWTNILASENLYLPVILAAILAFLKAENASPIQWHWLLVSGLLLGIGALIRPATLLFPAIFVLAHIFKKPPLPFSVQGLKIFAEYIFVGVLLSIAMLAPVLPWTLRNEVVFNRFVLIATEGGTTFLQGHNERTTSADYAADGPVFDQLNSENLDEVAYDKRAYQLAFEFIRHNPLFELRLLVHKFINFFKDDVSGITYNDLSAIKPLPGWFVILAKGSAEVYYLLIMGLAVASIFIAHFPKDRSYLVLLIFILVWLAIHLAFYGKDRFRLPLTPAFALFASLSLLALWDKYIMEKVKLSSSRHSVEGA